MRTLGTLILIVAMMVLGCGDGSGGSSSSGGTGGASGGSGGTGGSCTEPTPPGWVGPFDPFTEHLSPTRTLTVFPDEAGGLAGLGPKIGPLACAGDFTRIEAMYLEGTWQGYTYAPPPVRRATVVRGGPDERPERAPFADPALVSECSDACEPPFTEGEYTFFAIPLASPIHAEAGEILYPTVQLDDGVGVGVTDEEMDPDPGWYYGPPGSTAGGDAGLWTALDQPPPGIPTYRWAPIVRLR